MPGAHNETSKIKGEAFMHIVCLLIGYVGWCLLGKYVLGFQYTKIGGWEDQWIVWGMVITIVIGYYMHEKQKIQ